MVFNSKAPYLNLQNAENTNICPNDCTFSHHHWWTKSLSDSPYLINIEPICSILSHYPYPCIWTWSHSWNGDKIFHDMAVGVNVSEPWGLTLSWGFEIQFRSWTVLGHRAVKRKKKDIRLSKLYIHNFFSEKKKERFKNIFSICGCIWCMCVYVCVCGVNRHL